MIRLLIVMPEVFYGGAETQFRLLIDGLDPAKYRVTLAIERSTQKIDRSEDEAWLRQRTNLDWFEFGGLYTHRGFFRKLVSASILGYRLYRLNTIRRFDVALVYSAIAMRTIPVLRAAGVKTVYSERNDGLMGRSAYLRRSPYLRAADRIVCNSRAASENLLRHRLSSVVIVNGVPPRERLPFRNLRSQPPCLHVLLPARISPVKNQEVVVRALARTNASVHVRFAGETEDYSYLQVLHAKAAELGVSESVSFLGRVSDMASAYATADLVILPSWSEGTPNVLLEAMSLGVLVAASGIPSNVDVLGASGLTFDPRSDRELARLFDRVSQMSDRERTLLTDQGHERVRSSYSIENMVSRFDQVLSQTVGI